MAGTIHQLSPSLAAILACPACGSSLALSGPDATVCSVCGQTYQRLEHTWDFIPPTHYRDRSAEWQAWDILQANGMASYRHDPEHNLGVGSRPDCLAFSRFCRFDGMVLDVGAGPQSWPTYFSYHAEGTIFVGVDPLAGGSKAEYASFRALGEHLPFRTASFDHVVFATSLDHFVDPRMALQEAARVCRPSGSIEIWIGEKNADAPRPAVSPAWYQALQRPDGADDVFHWKRLTAGDVRPMLDELDLTITEAETHQIDAYRTHYFCRAARRSLRAPKGPQ
jgi:SAM-dependent methyltransferase